MIITEINYVSVLVAAAINMAVGFYWYSKAGFGKQWMVAIGKTEADIQEGARASMYIWMILNSLIVAYVLAVLIVSTETTTVIAGAVLAFLSWLGFVVTTNAANVIFEGKPRAAYLINMGYNLVSFLLMGGLLAVWS